MVVAQKIALGRMHKAPDRHRAHLETTVTVEPGDGDIRVIRRTTTQPVNSIKGQRPRTATSVS